MVILESPLLFISSSTRLLRTTEEDLPEFVKKAGLPAHSYLGSALFLDVLSCVWLLATSPSYGPAFKLRPVSGRLLCIPSTADFSKLK